MNFQNILIYGTALITVMGVSIILPVIPQMAQAFDVSKANIGLFIYAFTLPGIFLAPVGGILADRYGRKTVLLPCLIIFALGGFFAALSTSIEFFIFWRALQGCGAACLGVLYVTVIGDLYADNTKRLTIMGKAATFISIGTAIFPAIGGFLGEISWQWPLFISLFSLPLAVLCFFTPLPQIKQKNDMAQYAKDAKSYILQKNAFMHLGLTICAFCVLYGPILTYFPLFTNANYTATPSQIGMLFAISSAGTVFATLFLGKLSKRFQPRILIYMGATFFMLCMLCLLFWPTNLPLWALTIPILFYGLGQGLCYPTIMSSLSTLAPASGRGILMAANSTSMRFAQSISPFICGYIFLWGTFSAVFSFGLIMGASIIFLALTANIQRT